MGKWSLTAEQPPETQRIDGFGRHRTTSIFICARLFYCREYARVNLMLRRNFFFYFCSYFSFPSSNGLRCVLSSWKMVIGIQPNYTLMAGGGTAREMHFHILYFYCLALWREERVPANTQNRLFFAGCRQQLTAFLRLLFLAQRLRPMFFVIHSQCVIHHSVSEPTTMPVRFPR